MQDQPHARNPRRNRRQPAVRLNVYEGIGCVIPYNPNLRVNFHRLQVLSNGPLNQRLLSMVGAMYHQYHQRRYRRRFYRWIWPDQNRFR